MDSLAFADLSREEAEASGLATSGEEMHRWPSRGEEMEIRASGSFSTVFFDEIPVMHCQWKTWKHGAHMSSCSMHSEMECSRHTGQDVGNSPLAIASFLEA